MKKVIICLLVLLPLFATEAPAQNPHVPTRKGTVLKYRVEDAQGRHTGYRRIVVKEALDTPEGLLLTTVTSGYDTDDRPHEKQPAMEYTILVTDYQVIYMKEGMIPKVNLPGEAELVLEGDDVSYPVSFSPGDKFPAVRMIAYSRKKRDKGDKMTRLMNISYEGRVVGANENVTVPYGTFDAMTLTEHLKFSGPGGMFAPDQSTTRWLVPGIGQVQICQYDKKGKLITTSQLVSVTVPD